MIKPLLNPYRSLIRSKLHHGSIIYGCSKTIPENLRYHHQGLRLALGAFRTSPIESLYAEACEPFIYKRQKLALQYITKLAASPQNLAYNDIFKPLYKQFYENQPNTIKLLVLRMESIIKEANIDIQKVANISLPQIEPWILKSPEILLELNQGKMSQINPMFLKNKFF